MSTGLTREQFEQFERDGILVLEDFLSPTEVEAVRTEIHRIVENMDPATDRGVFSTKDDNQKQVVIGSTGFVGSHFENHTHDSFCFSKGFKGLLKLYEATT